MKKFRSRRGFTIIETLVAFVIFAIMAGMVSMILAQINQVRQQNTDVREEIENQKEVYYLKDQKYEYKSENKQGEISLEFDGLTNPVKLDYAIGDPNAEDDPNILALQYFIGNVTYKMSSGKKDENDENGNAPGSVTNRLDTRVYGTSGITQVTAMVTKDTSYTGTGYRYFMKSMASYSGIDEQKWFAQYRFIFPSVILDYGYTQQSDSPVTVNSRFDTSTLPFEVYSPYNRTLRISSKQSSTETNPPAVSNKYLYYYVVLEEPLEDIDADLDLNKIFGYSNSEQTSTKNASGSFTFEPYTETITNDETGEQSTATFPNIFGAFPSPEEEEETPSTDETSES